MNRFFQASARDDRGNAVEVLSHAAAGHWVVAGDARIEGMLYRVANPGPMRGGWDWIGLVMIAGIGIAMVVLLRMIFPGGPGWTMWLVGLAAGSATAWVLARVWTARNAARLAAAVIEEGLCPSCGYNLHGLGSAEDGCVQCPECGAAWKAARIVRSEPIAPGAVYGDPALTVGKSATRMVTDRFDTTDSRGRAVRVMDVARLNAAVKRCRDEGEKERLAGLKREVMRRTAGVRWMDAGALWVVAIFVWYVNGPLTAAICALGLSVCFILGQFGVSMKAARDALLEEGACAGCASRLNVREDGVGECGKCRAAWWVGKEEGGGKGEAGSGESVR